MAKLAINGGPRTIDRQIGKSWPIHGETERANLLEVLESGHWWRGGEAEASMVARFEQGFAAFQDAKYGVAITNGTQAIECALKAIGVKPGDEVICPAATFVATATACILVNAIPIVVDIDPANYQISPAAIEAAITERTVGIIPVHYGGYPVDMASIREIASRHGLWIIEDAAHAHGSTWNGQGCGSLSDIGCFSLQQSKHLISGQGGLTVTNDPVLQEILSIFPHKGGPHYSSLGARNYLQFGYNYHLTELQAAVALSQLPGLEALCARRAFLGDRLNAKLAGLPGFYPQVVREGDRCTYWMYVLRVVAEEAAVPAPKVAEALRAEGVACGYQYIGKPIFMYEAIRRQQVYGTSNYPFTLRDGEPLRYDEEYCPGCVQALDEMVVIPIHELYTDEDIDQIAEACAKIATWAW